MAEARDNSIDRSEDYGLDKPIPPVSTAGLTKNVSIIV